MEKCYSTNNEDFNYTEEEDAVNDVFDFVGAEAGAIATIYEGDAVKWKAGDFARCNIDSMSECACDEAGEYAKDYLNGVGKEEEADLDKRIADVVNQWADDYGLQPGFYRVENIKEIQVKLLNTETGEYEEQPCRQ